MRPSLYIVLTLIATMGLSASPAHAQFAAEDPGALPANGIDEEAGYDQADPYAAEVDPADPYAAEPAYGTAQPQSIGDRSIAELTTGILGANGAQRARDAEAIVRTVIGKAGSKGGTPGSPGADPVGLVQDILAATRKTKDPQ